MPSFIKENEPLQNHCSYKTGGPARFYAEPNNTAELIDVLQWNDKHNHPLYIIGLGSNVLFSDAGVDGLIISLKSLNTHIQIDSGVITAGAGVVLDNLIRFSLKNGYSGMENLSGIPGCIGGNIFMNAGAFGTEMKDVVERITIIDRQQQISTLENAAVGFQYRKTANLVDKIVLSADFKLNKMEEISAANRNRSDIIQKRTEKQPLDYPSCGSVFKRPEDNYAGTLIDQCDLKGVSIGGATVSQKHANFIINEQNATSTDIYNLIQHVKQTVKAETGVQLEEEVKFIGF